MSEKNHENPQASWYPSRNVNWVSFEYKLEVILLDILFFGTQLKRM
jgi:hypothetical protein